MEEIKKYLNSVKISFVEMKDGSLMLVGNTDGGILLHACWSIYKKAGIEIKMSLSHLFVSQIEHSIMPKTICRHCGGKASECNNCNMG